MNRAHKRVFAAITAGALALLPGTAVADQQAGTHVDSLNVSKSGSILTVGGTAAFVDIPQTLGTDGTGDAAAPNIGADVTYFKVSRTPFSNSLTFEMGIADQTPQLQSAPTVLYTWPLIVGEEDAQLFLEARRYSAFQPTGTTASFFLSHDTPDGIATSAISGTMGTGFVRWTVPANKCVSSSAGNACLGIDPGDKVGQGGAPVGLGTTTAAPGALWFYGNANGDGAFLDTEYEAPAPSVQLGIAPAGTPVATVPLSSTASVASSGNYTGFVDVAGLAGDYVVAVKACYGSTNCGLASSTITL